MLRLLGANFARLKKSHSFWSCATFMAVYGAAMVCIDYYSLCRYGYEFPLDLICFDYANLMGFVSAVFVTLFLGMEYSDGTIRNKLTVGHRRHTVYLAGLIVSASGVIIINAVYAGVVFLLDIPLLGFSWSTESLALLALILMTLLMDLAYTAVFTLCSMLNQNKATVVAVGILSVLMLSILSGYIRSRLNEPEVYEAYAEVTDKGDIVTREEEENPYYLEGIKREICVFFNDFLPCSQGMQIENRQTDRAWQCVLYSCLIVAVSTGAGILLFCRKDIR